MKRALDQDMRQWLVECVDNPGILKNGGCHLIQGGQTDQKRRGKAQKSGAMGPEAGGEERQAGRDDRHTAPSCIGAAGENGGAAEIPV